MVIDRIGIRDPGSQGDSKMGRIGRGKIGKRIKNPVLDQ